MRKVIYSMMTSLDGFIARPNGDLDWVTMSEELHTFANEQEKQVDTNLYGRRMYEVMAAYWPTADQNPDAHDVEIEYARLWQQAEKIVFSTTLEQVEGNARIVRDNIADEVNALKARPGKGISIGGADIAATFMRLGLIDAYHIYLHPVILGEGIPMFPTPEATRHLHLVESLTFASGVLFLHYEPAIELPAGLSNPSRRALASIGITRLNQIPACSAAEMLKLHGMGQKGIQILREALGTHGLAFAEEEVGTVDLLSRMTDRG